LQRGVAPKSSGKCFSALMTGYGVNPPRAQSEPNFMVWQIFQHSDVRRASLARPDLVNGFDAARRTDTTWRAFAAGFDGTELHRKPRLLCHVHCVVEDHDAAVTDQPSFAVKAS
jgi:hypothetical protein